MDHGFCLRHAASLSGGKGAKEGKQGHACQLLLRVESRWLRDTSGADAPDLFLAGTRRREKRKEKRENQDIAGFVAWPRRRE
jgi:hypothetical protein